VKVHDALWNKYSVLTAHVGSEEYSGLRVTPHIYSTLREVDFFAEMVERELKTV
jgi:selenocysteine lyase/cysteine desulfurase